MWHRRTLTTGRVILYTYSSRNRTAQGFKHHPAEPCLIHGQSWWARLTMVSLSEVHENRETYCIIEGVTSQLTPPCHIIEHHLQLISIDNKGWAELSARCCSFYRNSNRKRTFGSFCTQAGWLHVFTKCYFFNRITYKHACACDTGHTHKSQILLSHTRKNMGQKSWLVSQMCPTLLIMFHIPALIPVGWQWETFLQHDTQLNVVIIKQKLKESFMIGFIRTLIKRTGKKISSSLSYGYCYSKTNTTSHNKLRIYFGSAGSSYMTQQEASVPSAAGRKPEQLLPKTFGSPSNSTKGHWCYV